MNAVPHLAPVRTTCAYCGVGCGLIVSTGPEGRIIVEGDPDHPANFGKLCSKGSALAETLGLETRLLHPLVDGRRTDWSTALDRVAEGFQDVIARHGPESVAFYLSGQLLTEDYYVANKLMKGFLGSGNVDTNSRLCMASSVAGHKRAFGSDTVPGCYEDLDEADLIVLVGSNAAWCHPVLFQRMLRAKQKRGTRIVNIDVRRTATSESADLQLTIRPGMDAVLFAGLLSHLNEDGAINSTFVGNRTDNFEKTLSAARQIAPDLQTVSDRTGLSVELIARFYGIWAATSRVVTIYSQGVNQSAQGTDKVNAIINCHLATGRIGQEGQGPLSFTGQPNAMGGREVGGLANQLAAHMGFSPQEVDRVRRFWNAPRMATREGLKAVDMFDAVAAGRIKALWVMGTNPVVSLPNADAVREGLSKLDLFVVSDNVAHNDTIDAGAQVVLPAAAWGEKDGTVTNSERRISRQRAFMPLPGEVRYDWQIICDVAHRMGFGEAFSYGSAGSIFREHAALSAFENDGARDFDLSDLQEAGDSAYRDMKPTFWPARNGEQKRMFADGRFFTTSGRAQFVPVGLPELKSRETPAFPLLLNTGRTRDQWHTMTRTGLSPRLGAHRPEPYVEIHPDDAARFELDHGGFARVASERGAAVLRVLVTDEQAPGMVFAPIHWNDQIASHARVGALLAAFTDPYSGQPELKATPVAVSPVRLNRGGFVLSRDRISLPRDAVWSWSAVDGGFGCVVSSRDDASAILDILRAHYGAAVEELAYLDEARGLSRHAFVREGRLVAVAFWGEPSGFNAWAPLMPAWTRDHLDETSRRVLLSGRLLDGVKLPGPIICACNGVSSDLIDDAVQSGCADAEQVGRATQAGTSCGSCLPEIRKIIVAVTDRATRATESV